MNIRIPALVSGVPLFFSPILAARVGLAEAILLEQVHLSLQEVKALESSRPAKLHRHFVDGRWWLQASYAEMQLTLPFWSVATIARTVRSAEMQSLLVSRHFGKSRGDRRKWYSVEYEVIESIAQERSASSSS